MLWADTHALTNLLHISADVEPINNGCTISWCVETWGRGGEGGGEGGGARTPQWLIHFILRLHMYVILPTHA